MGVPDHSSFETGDLYDASNPKQVICCLQALGHAATSVSGYSGPVLSVTGSAKKVGSTPPVQVSGGKVQSLSSSLKISVATPRAEPGSTEWFRQQREQASKDANETSPGTREAQTVAGTKSQRQQAAAIAAAERRRAAKAARKTRTDSNQRESSDVRLTGTTIHPTMSRARRAAKRPSSRRVRSARRQSQESRESMVTASSAPPESPCSDSNSPLKSKMDEKRAKMAALMAAKGVKTPTSPHETEPGEEPTAATTPLPGSLGELLASRPARKRVAIPDPLADLEQELGLSPKSPQSRQAPRNQPSDEGDDSWPSAARAKIAELEAEVTALRSRVGELEMRLEEGEPPEPAIQ